MRCTINLDNFRKTETGKTKIWQTDGIKTYCCSLTPSLFVWERNTRANNYQGYSGYVQVSDVTILK